MGFPYSQDLIDQAFTYTDYRKSIEDFIAKPATDEASLKRLPYTRNNAAIMDRYDASLIDNGLKALLANAPATTWLVLTEGWCGDAAFNVPVLAAIERAVPGKVKLRLLLRDANPELMDAHLTDGGRSIPKLIVLNEDLSKLGVWGPRPEGLQQLMKQWKSNGMELKELIPKVQDWYDTDATMQVQQELTAMVKSYM
jgi:hypothetical protein